VVEPVPTPKEKEEFMKREARRCGFNVALENADWEHCE